MLYDSARRDESQLALVCGPHSVTYGELSRLVETRVTELGSDRKLVLIEAQTALEPVVTYLACLKAHHPVMMVSTANVESTLSTYQPDVVFSCNGGQWDLRHVRSETIHTLHPDLALMLSTSGSTGSPKFVRLSRDNVESNAVSIADYLSLTPADRATIPLPLHYCYGLSVLHSHLQVGAAVVLTSLSVSDPCFWDEVRSNHVTMLPAVPYTFELLERVDFASMDVPSLRTITQAGGRLAPELVERYATLGQRRGFELFVMYGATEATSRMAYLPPEWALDNPCAIGQPIPGGELSIAEDGELIYCGPNVMMGYAHSGRDLADGSGDMSLATGDLARRNANGMVEIVGRKSRFLKMYGLRISLDTVESRLGSCVATGTDELLVIAATDSRDSADLHRQAVAEFGLPTGAVCVIELAEVPRLDNNKVDYLTIRDHGLALAAADRPLGKSVAAIFETALGTSPVVASDTFVELGGDSLSYVEVSVALEELLGHVPAAWHLQTVGELEAGARRTGPIRRVETGVLIRALAILAVLASHFELVNIMGGAHVLLAAAGFNFSRFLLQQIDRQDSVSVVVPSMSRIMVPTTGWLLLVFGVSQSFDLSQFLYVSHLDTTAGGGYWFIEILVQLLLAIALLFSVPAVRRAQRHDPFGFAAGVLITSIALRYALDAIWDTQHLGFKVFHMSAWLFALGWAAERSQALSHRVLLSGLTLATVPGFFDSWSRTAVILGGVLALIWVSSIPVVAPLNRMIGRVGGASLYLYLVHFQVTTFLKIDTPTLKFVVAIGCGLVAAEAGDWLMRQANRRVADRHNPPLVAPRARDLERV